MDIKISREWLLRNAERDEDFVSVGGLYSRMKAIDDMGDSTVKETFDRLKRVDNGESLNDVYSSCEIAKFRYDLWEADISLILEEFEKLVKKNRDIEFSANEWADAACSMKVWFDVIKANKTVNEEEITEIISNCQQMIDHSRAASKAVMLNDPKETLIERAEKLGFKKIPSSVSGQYFKIVRDGTFKIIIDEKGNLIIHNATSLATTNFTVNKSGLSCVVFAME